MKKYAKIVDKSIGLCEVGEGTNEAFYQSLGMSLRDVDKSEKDNQWYLSEKCPHYSEEELAAQEVERRTRQIKTALYELDLQAIRPLRAILAGTQTEEDLEKIKEIEAKAKELRITLSTLQ